MFPRARSDDFSSIHSLLTPLPDYRTFIAAIEREHEDAVLAGGVPHSSRSLEHLHSVVPPGHVFPTAAHPAAPAPTSAGCELFALRTRNHNDASAWSTLATPTPKRAELPHHAAHNPAMQPAPPSRMLPLARDPHLRRIEYDTNVSLPASAVVMCDSRHPAPHAKLGGVNGDLPATALLHVLREASGVDVKGVDVFLPRLGRATVFFEDASPKWREELKAAIDGKLWLGPKFAVMALDDVGKAQLQGYIQSLRLAQSFCRFPRHTVTVSEWVSQRHAAAPLIALTPAAPAVACALPVEKFTLRPEATPFVPRP